MLNETQLEELKKLSELFFSIKECALIMEIKESQLRDRINNSETKEHAAYYSGNFRGQARVRKSIIEMAERGSNPAQQLASKYIQDCELKNVKNK